MRRAFAVAQPAAVHGRHVGIVDDVMTSGATLDAAARALKYAGAARVTAFVVLRTP
ncbi:MAG: phosphoribosyltransferase family protein [Pararobbsia sp.]